MVREVNRSPSFGPSDTVPGTLMWVGDRELDEFVEAYRFCECRVSQLAWRRDVDDALRRPAAAVRRIVVTRPTRRVTDDRQLRELFDAYPAASAFELLGPLGGPLAGPGSSRAIRPDDPPRVPWHRANQILPEWLEACGAPKPADFGAARSVAVVAATPAAAEPLIDLAASVGVVAVWCRRGDTVRLRNVDVVWWDDSATGDMPRDEWAARVARFRRRGSRFGPRHAWLVTAPHIEQCRAAYDAGVELVVTKPARIEPLLRMLRNDAEPQPQNRPASPVTERTIEADTRTDSAAEARSAATTRAA